MPRPPVLAAPVPESRILPSHRVPSFLSYLLRQVVFRPLPKLSPYRTPVKGLFLGSAATFPGGAVNGVPGDVFYADPAGIRSLRFQFAVEPHVLDDVCERLARL